MSPNPITIVGAGLADLTLGRCLRQYGIATVVLERVSSSPRYSYGIASTLGRSDRCSTSYKWTRDYSGGNWPSTRYDRAQGKFPEARSDLASMPTPARFGVIVEDLKSYCKRVRISDGSIPSKTLQHHLKALSCSSKTHSHSMLKSSSARTVYTPKSASHWRLG